MINGSISLRKKQQWSIISPNVECDGLATTFFPVVPLLEPFLSDVTSSVYKRRPDAILLTFILGTLPVVV